MDDNSGSKLKAFRLESGNSVGDSGTRGGGLSVKGMLREMLVEPVPCSWSRRSV